jgi:hypothetical protein
MTFFPQKPPKGSYTPPKDTSGIRLFFECAECGEGVFHEEVLLLDHDNQRNRYNLGTMPCGGTEVHFLDGYIEKLD